MCYKKCMKNQSFNSPNRHGGLACLSPTWFNKQAPASSRHGENVVGKKRFITVVVFKIVMHLLLNVFFNV